MSRWRVSLENDFLNQTNRQLLIEVPGEDGLTTRVNFDSSNVTWLAEREMCIKHKMSGSFATLMSMIKPIYPELYNACVPHCIRHQTCLNNRRSCGMYRQPFVVKQKNLQKRVSDYNTTMRK